VITAVIRYMSVRRTRTVIAVVVAWSVCLATSPAFCAQTLDTDKMHKVQAAYVYNFAKFTQWPRGSFADDKAPIVIGVVGTDSIIDILKRAVRNKLAQGRAVRVVNLSWSRPNDREVAKRCHLLYICNDHESQLEEILAALARRPVLTVSEIEGFAESGGMIGLVLSENRVVFEINRATVAKGGLKLSARLLKLAKVVE